MKKILLFLCVLFYLNHGNAQSVTRLFGASPLQDSLWVFDSTNFQVVRRLEPTLPGFTITGMNGLARHPITKQIYIICKVSGVSGRVLGKLDPLTAIVTQIGNLGDNFSSITFNSNGTLYGVTGDGASVPETLYKISTTNASKTFLATLGNGADGEVICFNSFDNMIYHWSGNGTIIYEKIDTATFAVTDIPIIGTTNGETFGMVHTNGTQFIGTNIGSRGQYWYTDGTVSPEHGNTFPDDIRGTALVTCPRLITGTFAYCAGDSTQLTMATTASGSTFQWYKNGAAIFGATSQMYYAKTIGSYNCIVSDACGTDSLASAVVISQNPLPVVTLSGNTNLCPNGSNTLTGTSGGTRQWYKNGVLISGATAVTYTATTPGVYNMIKYNSNGCKDSAAVGKTVIAVAAPVVALGNDTTICAGASLTFNAQNAGSTFLWDNNSTNQTLTSTFTIKDTISVTVTNTNGCSSKDSIIISVNPLPVVTITGNSNLCPGASNVLTATSGGTRQWYKNGVLISGATAVTYTATTPGVYNMIKYNSNGCYDSASVGKTVVAVSSPVVALGNDTTICAGGSLTFNAQNTGSTFLWNNNSTNQTLTSTFTIKDTISVTVTNINGCASNDSIIISVNVSPIVALGNDTAICAGGVLTFNAQNTGSTFLWNNNSTNQTLTSTFTVKDTISVVVTNGSGCSSTDSIIIFVNALPVVAITGNSNLCPGGSNVLTATSGGTSQWYKNGVLISGATAVTFTATTPGVYNMIKYNSNGCYDSAAVGKTVVGVSAPVVALGNDTTFCTGNSITLNAQNTGSNYLWNTNATTQMVTVSSTDTVSVIVVNVNGCSATDTVVVTIKALPNVSLTLSTDTVCLNASNINLTGTPVGGVFTGSGVSGNSFNPTAAGTGSHILTYSYTDVVTGCSNFDSDTILVSICVGINEFTNSQSLHVFPNPVNGKLFIDLSEINENNIQISLFDITGKFIITQQVNGGNTAAIDLLSFDNGIYTVFVQTKNNIFKNKIVIAK